MTPTTQAHFHWRLLLQAVYILTSFPTGSATCPFQVTSDGLNVLCSYRRLTRIPATWPGIVTSLDVSKNNLTDVLGLNVPQLAGVRRLNLSHNFISTVPHDAFQDLSQLQELDLSDNGLLPLPQDTFRGLIQLTSLALRRTGLLQLPDMLLADVPRLVTLDLSSNALTRVPTTAVFHVPGLESLMLGDNGLTEIVNHSFAGLTELSKLDLSHNHLTLLQTAAFSGLGNLRELDLSYNHLVLKTDAYPAGVFSPLVSLHILTLHGNDDRRVGTYNMPALTSLSSLRTLSIDTFADAHFDQDFAGLTNITTFNLNQNCRMVHLRNTTFQAFKNSSLEILDMVCYVLSVEACAFCNLPRLKTLRYLRPQHSLDLSLSLLYGLQNQTMSFLELSRNKNIYPTVLSAANLRYLNTMCIETVIIKFAFVFNLEYSAFEIGSPFCECLKRADLSGNQIHKLPPVEMLKLLICFKNIEWLDLSDQLLFSRWPERYQPSENHDNNKTKDLMIAGLPKLSYLNMSGAANRFGSLARSMHFPHGHSLTTIDISYVGVRECEVKITGLTSLQTLIFSGNDCSTPDDDTFRQMTNLRHLGLADVTLDQDYVMGHVTQLLSPLELLEHLDLSNNDLYFLPPDMLCVKPRLQSLLLASNRFQSVPVDLDQQTDLSLLDLSNNMLTTLLPHERRLLDSLAQNHTVHVRLSKNPLSCTCAGLDFVRWLSRTAVRLDGRIHATGYDDDYDDNGRDYPCVLQVL